MAVKTLYVLGTTATSPNWFGSMQDGGTAPTAANATFGWGVGKNTISTPYYNSRMGSTTVPNTHIATSNIDSTTGPTAGTGATSTTAGDSFVIGPYTGTFANTAWTMDWNLRAGTAGAIGKVRCRVWKSANAAGTSATSLTASTLEGAIVTTSTTADTDSSMSWSPGSITLSNEYLFFQQEWQETTVGTATSSNALYRIGPALVTTPDFSAGSAAASLVWNPNPFQHMIIR